MSTLENEFLERIQSAQPEELRTIRDFELTHMLGITDEERAEYQRAVDVRFSQLNAQALGCPSPRWK